MLNRIIILSFSLLFFISCFVINSELIKAVNKNDIEQVLNLLEQGADVNARDEWGNIPLILAAYDGHERMVKILIKAGSNVNAENDGGFSALYFAWQNDHQEVAQLLIDAGAVEYINPFD